MWSGHRLNRPDQKQYVTLSMGIAWIDREHQYANIHELMKAADVQLYAAKHAGRDQYQAHNTISKVLCAKQI